MYNVINSNEGLVNPIVCILCDRFILPDIMHTVTVKDLVTFVPILQPPPNYIFKNDLKLHYTAPNNESISTEDKIFLSNAYLSPRASFLKARQDQCEGYTICLHCKTFMKNKKIPKFCIANNYIFGTAPKCLLDLTDVELAMITPVKTFGYCFSYTGGLQKQLKGSLSYYRMSKEHITESVAQLEAIGLKNHVIILLYGHFTPKQRDRARNKTLVRTKKVIKAVKWLIENNIQWATCRSVYDSVLNIIKNPIIIDNSILIEDITNTSNCIQNTETFQVFYPDGSASTLTGGQESLDDFLTIVQEASSQGYNMEYKLEIFQEAVYDYKDNNFVNSCLLQFPYGHGGLNENRYDNNKSGFFTTYIDITEYTTYLSLISIPEFQRELFTLILYNMQIKHKMVTSAMYKLRDKKTAQILGMHITKQDVTDAIDRARSARILASSNTHNGHTLLGTVDAVSKAVAHTNQATKIARRNVETLQHTFGCPSFFLTVTPDDDNHVIIQIYARKILQTSKSVYEMDNEEIFNMTKAKTELRIKYPGICAYFFENMLDIVFKEVLRWDKKLNKPLPNSPGLFGKIDAISLTIEEQGRRTLHAHILIWNLHYNELRTDLYRSTNRSTMRSTKSNIIATFDSIASTRCFFHHNQDCISQRNIRNAFPHTCQMDTKGNDDHAPIIVDDQQLRNLRCKNPRLDHLAFCTHCTKTWSSTQLVSSYLQYFIKLPYADDNYESNIRRLKHLAVEHQYFGENKDQIENWIVDIAYNHHIHTFSCFKNKSLDKSMCLDCECRYRFPQRKKRRTELKSSAVTHKWYTWNGEVEDRLIYELLPQRNSWDAFANTSCPAIALSKFTCNTNVSAIFHGPIAQYCVNYTVKNTQKDDVAEYELVKNAAEKILSKVVTHETDYQIALRRVLSATFAHQSNNIIGAALASYLTRNNSRFYFSHDFTWCPLRDLQNLLSGAPVQTSINMKSGAVPFFQCQALNYLCRPLYLENYSAYDFFSQFTVKKCTLKNVTTVTPFIHTVYFKHPSYCHKTKLFRQGVSKREKNHLVKIFQYDFIDSANFDGNILSDTTTITESMEIYCQNILLCFYAYRHKQTLLYNNSFTKKLRQLHNEQLFPQHVYKFLQNIQDTKANNYRSRLVQDDLQQITSPPDNNTGVNLNAVNDCTTAINQITNFEEFFANIDEYITPTIQIDPSIICIPLLFNSSKIRNKGRLKCGYDKLPDFSTLLIDTNSSSQQFLIYTQINSLPISNNNIDNVNLDSKIITQQIIGKLLFVKPNSEVRCFQDIFGSTEKITVLKANGSVSSILDWGEKAALDTDQRRAFEVIVSSFVLSFFKDAETYSSVEHRSLFNLEYRRLQYMVNQSQYNHKKQQSSQLICFLHGPAGSGKTAVIDLVLLYIKSYCANLWENEYNDRVVVVTAMTGVAATLLQGETTHSALYLNQTKTPICGEQIQKWSETRLVVIDEISFATKHQISQIDTKLGILKQKPYLRYGGIHIVFCGDFRQLEPVGKGSKPLYDEDVPQFKDSINCYIELNGFWRFRNDLKWGKLLSKLRNGKITIQDLDVINEHIRLNQSIPHTIKYATYYNKDRDAINTAIFEERAKKIFHSTNCTDRFMIIFSTSIQVRNLQNVYYPMANPSLFWENCGEDDINLPRGAGRMDPVLKLYEGCRVMLPINVNVAEGQANGTQAIVKQIVLKPNSTVSKTVICGYIPIPAVLASMVDYIVLEHVNTRINEPMFQIQPKQFLFKANLPCLMQTSLSNSTLSVDMKAIQFPIINNDATTGHKLQGSGVDKIYVHNWSYVTNWVYVLLSRVKTMNGLYARLPLSTDLTKYQLPTSYTNMINLLQRRIPCNFTDLQYRILATGSKLTLSREFPSCKINP